MKPKGKMRRSNVKADKEMQDYCGIFILNNRYPRGISSNYLTSAGSFVFQPPTCTLSRSPTTLLLFLQAVLPKMLLLWFTIVDHCYEIQAVGKMDYLGEKIVRGPSSPHTYHLL